jgi:hypothetical protein
MDRDNITDPLKFNSWTEISALMGTRTYRECARHWKYCQPNITKTAKEFTSVDYKDLLLRMIQSFTFANDESELMWKSIITSRDPFPMDTYRTKWFQLRSKVQEKQDLSDMTFKGINYSFRYHSVLP